HPPFSFDRIEDWFKKKVIALRDKAGQEQKKNRSCKDTRPIKKLSSLLPEDTALYLSAAVIIIIPSDFEINYFH
ncbi:MAG: hypothetical protein M1491_03510, partial [Deltaproteobacteria bacterium]|nr:hypothetical protein [Deltaproteobacteria bacterium]